MNPDPTLREAMDLLGLSAVDLSREFERAFGRRVPPQSIRQARLDPQNSGYRPAPREWETIIARLARRRLTELRDLAHLDTMREQRDWTDPRTGARYVVKVRRDRDREWGPAEAIFSDSTGHHRTSWRLGSLAHASDNELMGMLDRALQESKRH